MSRRPAAAMHGMVLPSHSQTDGVVHGGRWPLTSDDRVPRPLHTKQDGWFDEEHDARVAGHSPYTDDACPDGRHLFDIIESYVVRYAEADNGRELEELDFRARLTCVRCGKILEWEGTRTEQHVGRIQAAPLVASDLVAQQVRCVDSFEAGREMSTWVVYRDGVEVGTVTWARGQRGRRYHVARLHDWHEGQNVEGPDPAAALRKLARTVSAAMA